MTKAIKKECFRQFNILGNRDVSVDILKGICIILMILAHTYNYGPLCGAMQGYIYSFHMPAFIFVNALYFKKISMNDRVVKSVKTLIVPYMVTSVINIPFLMMIYEKDFFTAVKSIVLCFGALPNDSYCSIGQLWFLGTLFFIHIFYTIILRIKDKRIQLASVLLLSIFGVVIGEKYILPWNIDISLACLIIFYLGNNYKDIRKKIQEKVNISNYYVITGFLVLSVSNFLIIKVFSGLPQLNIGFRKYPFGVIGLIVSAVVVMFLKECCSILKEDYLISKLLSYVGRYSLLFLCVHTLDTYCVNKILQNNLWDIPIFVLRFTLIFVIVFIINWVINTKEKKWEKSVIKQ